MVIKTTVEIVQATNWRDWAQEDLERSKKGKNQERNEMYFNMNINVRNNYIKARIGNTQKNCKCRLFKNKTRSKYIQQTSTKGQEK